MKISAVILSFLYFFSSTSPFIVEDQPEAAYVSKKTCCEKATSNKCGANNKQRRPKKDPCKDCMSVLVCPLCVYEIAGQAKIPLPPQIQKLVNKKPQNNCSLSSYHAECWHPPELLLHV